MNTTSQCQAYSLANEAAGCGRRGDLVVEAQEVVQVEAEARDWSIEMEAW